jgi:hypothetical protein
MCGKCVWKTRVKITCGKRTWKTCAQSTCIIMTIYSDQREETNVCDLYRVTNMNELNRIIVPCNHENLNRVLVDLDLHHDENDRQV